MNYRLTHKVRTKDRLWRIGAPILFLGVILFFHVIYPSSLAGFLSRVASPFWSVWRSIGEETQALLFFFSSKQTLGTEVDRLSRELLEANLLLADRDLLLTENTLLKEQFGRSNAKESRVIGTVLASPPRSPYDTAVLDVGESAGVEVGDRALVGSVVLGVVSRVYPRTSVVEFYSTAGKKTEVSILHDHASIPVEAVGQGGGEFAVTLPKEVSIGVGDKVVMQGINPFLFAIVEALQSSPTDSFETVRFKNPVPFSALRFLEIEKVVIK